MTILRRARVLALLTASFILAGCTTIDNSYKKYDPSRKYLHSDLYFSEPIEVPPTLSKNKLEDYYPVPEVTGKQTDDKPQLTPPSNTIKGVD
jgi:uncharacterized lipoprotein